MNKQLRKIVSMLLTVCLLLSVLPGEILATDGVSTAVGDGSVASDGTSVLDEGAVIAPEAALLADCQVLRYVNEEVFREKNHVSRVPGEETLSSYVFQNADGSRTVYFLDEPVKYVDSAGVVREKDLTLKAVGTDGKLALSTSKAVAGYTTAANDIGLTLPTNPADGIRLTYEGAQVTLIPQGGTKGVVAQMADGAVTYPDFYGKGMSLRYTPLLSGVKEDIILRSYTGVNTFTFLLNTGGLGLYQENGRYYVASSPDAETPIELGDLVTFDAHGRFSVGTTTAETLTPNQSYRLTLTVDEAFLTDENTTYPVTIDPTLEIENSAIHDATIYSGTPNLNANWTYLHAGYYDDTYKMARTLFRFPTLIESDVYTQTSQYQITSANLHIREATGSAPVEVGVYATQSVYTWEESTVTWNNVLAFIKDRYANGAPGYGNETTYDITHLVKAWQNGVETANSGLMLRSSNETSVDKAFYATEWSGSAYRPYLEVTYIDSGCSLNYTSKDIDVGATFDLNAYGLPSEPMWTSSDTSVATVSSTGVVTGIKPGNVSISAKLTGYKVLSCTVYVTVPDAVYYLGSYTGKYLAVDGSLDDGAPLKLLTKTANASHAKMRQLWKIKHIESGFYSIRSLYKSDRCVQVASNRAKLSTVGTSDSLSTFSSNELWKIEYLPYGYILRNVGTDTCLYPSDTDPVANSYSGGNSWFAWTLTPDTTVPDLVILIDAETCLPAHSTFHTLYEGEEATLEDLGLMVSYISQTTNTSNYYWGVSDSNVAGITAQNKVVVYGRGETVFTLYANGSTNTPMYFTVHSPYVDDGTYYIRNWETDRYIELTDSGHIYGEIFSHSSSQLWDITYLGNREYSIRSHQSTSQYLAINGDSTAQAALVVSKTGSLTSGMRWTFTKADSGAFRISAQCAPDLNIQASTYGDRYIRQYAPETSGSQYSEWLFCETNSQIIPEVQEGEYWCWVTCARMASSMYMKSPITQASAALYAYSGHKKLELNLLEYETVYTIGYPEHTAKALEYIIGWEGCTYYKRDAIYSEERLIALLQAGNVVIAGRVSSSGCGGHAILIYDYRLNPTTPGYEFYIYDPWYEYDDPMMIRSYSWLRNGYDNSGDYDADGLIWNWIVTFQIGEYTRTTPAPVIEMES